MALLVQFVLIKRPRCYSLSRETKNAEFNVRRLHSLADVKGHLLLDDVFTSYLREELDDDMIICFVMDAVKVYIHRTIGSIVDMYFLLTAFFDIETSPRVLLGLGTSYSVRKPIELKWLLGQCYLSVGELGGWGMQSRP